MKVRKIITIINEIKSLRSKTDYKNFTEDSFKLWFDSWISHPLNIVADEVQK